MLKKIIKLCSKNYFILILLFSLAIISFSGVVSGAIVGGSMTVSQVNPYMVFNYQPVIGVSCGATVEIDNNADFSSLVYSTNISYLSGTNRIRILRLPVDYFPKNVTLYWRIRETSCSAGPAPATYNGPSFVVKEYLDIGLRIQTSSGTVSVAAEAGILTSPLRIAKNGTTYGLVLVDPSDICAVGVRIQTSSGIKSLIKQNCSRYVLSDDTYPNFTVLRLGGTANDLLVRSYFVTEPLSNFDQTIKPILSIGPYNIEAAVNLATGETRIAYTETAPGYATGVVVAFDRAKINTAIANLDNELGIYHMEIMGNLKEDNGYWYGVFTMTVARFAGD